MAQLAVGDEFAGCRVEKVIGAGGMGVVYRGTDLNLERPVAIKLIAADRAGDESARRRFEREARLMAAIDHPNVIPVYAAGEQDGDLYLVMRYVDGTDLQRRLRDGGPMDPKEAARIVDQVAKALDAAHARGLVHRDIKPGNVLLSGDHVYLTDFGITRLVDENTRTTETGDWVGTIDFMAPEHLRGDETDARSDVYSLGCVLYACLTGVPPFKRTTVAATIAAHLNDRPPAPSQTTDSRPPLPRGFDQVIGRALAKKPAHRYASAGELGEAALAAAEGRPTRWGKNAKRTNNGPSEAPTRIVSDLEGPTRVVAPEDVADELAADDAGRRRMTPRRGTTARTRVAGTDTVPTLHLAGKADANGEGLGWRGRPPLAAGAAALLLAALAAVVVVVVLHKSKPKPVTPLTSAQVSGVIQRFADAYTSRNAGAMAALLAPGITRMDPTTAEHGATAVLADYRQQFKTTPVPVSYRLTGMVITGGWVGRASGSYTLRLQGGDSLQGHVVFAIQRVDGRAVIGLIVTQQDSTSGPAATATRTAATTTSTPMTTTANAPIDPAATPTTPAAPTTPATPNAGGPAAGVAAGGSLPVPGKTVGRGLGHHHHGGF